MTIFGGEVVQVTDIQRLDGQEVVNVYHYEVSTDYGGIQASELAMGWWARMGDMIRDVQSSSLTHVLVRAESLDGAQDYGEYIIPPAEQAGNIPVAPAASFLAWGITLRPANKQVRPGGKRFSGVVEEYMGANGALMPDIITMLDVLGDALVDPVGWVNFLDALNPVIVGWPHPVSPTGRPARAARVDIPVTGYVLNPYVTTQNTRKRGRGV